MSLLMDALKRAETSKQEAARSLSGKEPPSPDNGLSLEPLNSPASRLSASPLPDLAAHIDAVDAELATSATPQPTIPPPPSKPLSQEQKSAQADRAAVRNAFAAKLANEKPANSPLWLVLGTLGLAAGGIAAYVGYQMLNMGNSSLAVPAAGPRPPLAAPALTPPASAEANSPPANTFQPPSPVITDTSAFSPPPMPRQVPTSRPEPASEEPIRLTRSKPEVDANQLRGYAHIERNELDLARRDYELALQRDPNNTDALIALGSIAQRQGHPADAERFFQRAMVANPADPAVQAAILNGSTASVDPQNTESRIKSLLAGQPESASLNFALGNLYARQGRWSEAQQSYFNAVAAEGDNPDYLFNLAVSLDHIRQNKLAAQHYRLALEAAEKRPAAFDSAALRKRLSQLQQQP